MCFRDTKLVIKLYKNVLMINTRLYLVKNKFRHPTVANTRDFCKISTKILDNGQPLWLFKTLFCDLKLVHMSSYMYYLVETSWKSI